MEKIEERLNKILNKYSSSFNNKHYAEESEETDLLMDAFGISQSLKKENKQYWGRELGMCWQLLLTEIFKQFCDDFQPAKKYGEDEPADFFIGNQAIDTKYRIGSGDSGTLKKFKQYGDIFQKEGLIPILLLLRTDNLLAAISAFKAGGWKIYSGEDTFDYIFENTGFDLKNWLINSKNNGKYTINR